ncbi:hypothetical protein [Pyrobaculum sp.]|uniref:hypothetical protein n=1 Tax=Pyrobaculum sp. TaxID=2004705 RepID=UPI00316C7334
MERECVTVRYVAEELSRKTGKSLYEAAYEIMLRVKRGEYAVESAADSYLLVRSVLGTPLVSITAAEVLGRAIEITEGKREGGTHIVVLR